MEEVFYLLEGFFIIGIIGTLLANRSAVAEIRKQRWLKLSIHFIIVHVLVVCIIYFFTYFYLVTIFILVIGFYEIFKYSTAKKRSLLFYVCTFLIFTFFAIGFFLTSKAFASNLLLYIFMIVFVFDGFSQISGQVFGRRLLFPLVSPGKTVEGFAGGAVVAILTSIIIRKWILLPVMESMYLCFLLITASVFGDWLASYYKRKHNIKDFSRLIPGHGGMLDRFDSWIAASAIIYYAFICGLLNFL